MMRRKEREVTDPKAIDHIIDDCDCCRVGLYDTSHKQVYIVPMNFAYDKKARTFYFHCAREGRKLDLIGRDQNVGFELDTSHKLVSGSVACGYSYLYQSVIGTGTMEILEGTQVKKEALTKIMRHYTKRDDWTYKEQMLQKVSILALHVETISCKEHL